MRSGKSDEENVYTLRDLIQKKHTFWEDKIFEVLDNNHPEKCFKFIHLKVKKIKERDCKSAYLKEKVDESNYKTLIQIIDMSDKMLYNEVKAEQSFLTLINATVSHELRNPLASLIGQRDQLKDLLKNLKEVITYSEKLASHIPEMAKITKVMKNIHEGLNTCTKKIVSASKFIDYFVHDMLDYTILNKEEKNFTKTLEKFNIQNAINEIIEI